MIDIQAIRASTDLVALIAARVKLTRKGREYAGLCPFHNEKTPSFSVVPEKRFFHCFGCGAHGDALDFVMRTEGLTLPEAAARLGGKPADAETSQRLANEQAARQWQAEQEWRRRYKIEGYRDRNPHCVCPDWALDV